MNYEKNLNFELIRFFTAYGVAVTHYLSFNGIVDAEFLSIIFVEIFFPLSGFLLAPQILKYVYSIENLGVFYLRRWLRTIPIFLMGLFLISILVNKMLTIDFFKYIFFIKYLFIDFQANNYFPIAWSLCVEEFFYILFPFFVLFKNLRLFAIFIFIFLKLYLLMHLDIQSLRISTIYRLDSIMIGFFAFQYKEFFLRNMKYNILIYALTLISILFYYSNSNKLSLNLFISLMPLSVSLFLVYLEKIHFFIYNKNWIRSIIVILGSTSYACYIFHIIIFYIGAIYNVSFFNQFLILFLSTIITHYLIEKPFISLRPSF